MRSLKLNDVEGVNMLNKILKSISNHKLETVTLIASLVSLYISMYR